MVGRDIDLNLLFKSRFIRCVICRVMKTKSLASDAPKAKLSTAKLKPNIPITTKLRNASVRSRNGTRIVGRSNSFISSLCP